MRAPRLPIAMLATLTGLATVFGPGARGAGFRHGAPIPRGEAHDARCDVQPVSTARGAFKAAVAAGRFADADRAIEPIWEACVSGHRQLEAETGGAIANDRATALRRAGQDHDCLEVLEDYWPADRVATPAFAPLSPALKRAMKLNWRLCHPGCDSGAAVDPVCASLAADEGSQRRVPGFRHVPCPLRKGASAVGLADGSCLALLPPRKAFNTETAPDDRLSDICPIPARLRRVGGRTVTEPLRTPERSFLWSVEHCCDVVDLAVDASGRISAEPHDNPPGDCMVGHPTDVMQDIFRLERGRLTLIRQLAQPWRPQK
jgi:hypothetical protein